MVTTTLKVKPTKLKDFEIIKKIGHFNCGIYSHLETDETCKSKILSEPVSTKEEELVLYWEGKNQRILGGKDLYAYFESKGYEVVEKAHPSLLINAMKELTEDKLTEMGIPSYVDIVLPTSEDSLFPGGGGLCFLGARRFVGGRELILYYVDGEWDGFYAFLLRRRLNSPSSPETLGDLDSLTLEKAIQICKYNGLEVIKKM